MAACFLRANQLNLVKESTFVYPKSGEQLTLSRKNGTIYFKGAVKKVFVTTI
jgi:diaminopimelate epimerase